MEFFSRKNSDFYWLFKSRLIGVSPWDTRYALHWEKGREPKNPLSAENGEGCGDLIIRCFDWSISEIFCWANAHRRIKTSPCFSLERTEITASVKRCRPASLWEFGESLRTVSPALRRKTPCSARFWRFHDTGGSISKSDFNSLKIFLREGGILMPSGTEKLNPCASHTPW